MMRKPKRSGTGHHLFADANISPIHGRNSQSEFGNGKNTPLDLIKEEIAIMKKLNHVNLVSLLEVLDDPDEDSLYMVLVYCKKGVVMKVGVEGPADPYDEPTSRYWFRQMILGIEYRMFIYPKIAFLFSFVGTRSRRRNY